MSVEAKKSQFQLKLTPNATKVTLANSKEKDFSKQTSRFQQKKKSVPTKKTVKKQRKPQKETINRKNENSKKTKMEKKKQK